MAAYEQIPPEQWEALCAAPWAVGLYVATAVGGKVQEVREMLVLGTALRRALERGYEDDLVGAVAAAVLGEAPMHTNWGLRPDDRQAMLRAVAAAGAAATPLSSGMTYRRWLMELAREVAAAEADGGFLGLGSETTHQHEYMALADLAEALGAIENEELRIEN